MLALDLDLGSHQKIALESAPEALGLCLPREQRLPEWRWGAGRPGLLGMEWGPADHWQALHAKCGADTITPETWRLHLPAHQLPRAALSPAMTFCSAVDLATSPLWEKASL